MARFELERWRGGDVGHRQWSSWRRTDRWSSSAGARARASQVGRRCGAVMVARSSVAGIFLPPDSINKREPYHCPKQNEPVARRGAAPPPTREPGAARVTGPQRPVAYSREPADAPRSPGPQVPHRQKPMREASSRNANETCMRFTAHRERANNSNITPQVRCY